MDHQEITWTAQTTTDAAATLGAEWDKRDTKTAILHLRNTGGSNGVTYQLQGSVDGTNWKNIGSSANVAHDADAVVSVTDYWPRLRVRVNAQSGGSQTTIAGAGAACAA